MNKDLENNIETITEQNVDIIKVVRSTDETQESNDFAIFLIIGICLFVCVVFGLVFILWRKRRAIANQNMERTLTRVVGTMSNNDPVPLNENGNITIELQEYNTEHKQSSQTAGISFIIFL